MAEQKLTPKQEQFCQQCAKGESQSDAYRFAYNAENMTNKQVWEEASKLASNPKVSQRLFELHEAARERTLVSVESITKELNESRALAIEQDNPAEMTKASMAKAKIHGLDVHKVDLSGQMNVIIGKEDSEL